MTPPKKPEPLKLRIVREGDRSGHQLAKWAENTQRIIAMCQKAEMRPSHGWTWEPIVNNVHLEEGASIVNNRIYCPSVRLFLFKDTLYGDQ